MDTPALIPLPTLSEKPTSVFIVTISDDLQVDTEELRVHTADEEISLAIQKIKHANRKISLNSILILFIRSMKFNQPSLMLCLCLRNNNKIDPLLITLD